MKKYEIDPDYEIDDDFIIHLTQNPSPSPSPERRGGSLKPLPALSGKGDGGLGESVSCSDAYRCYSDNRFCGYHSEKDAADAVVDSLGSPIGGLSGWIKMFYHGADDKLREKGVFGY